MLTVPNLLSAIRLLLIPVLLGLAWWQQPRIFVGTLLFSLLTDNLDGFLARKLNQKTELGAKLDSWADAATWLALLPCAWWLRPEVLRAEAPWLIAGLACFLASIGFGFVKYRRLISYHTWGAKALSVIVAVTVLVFFAGGPGWVFHVAMPFVMLSALEEMAITTLLPTWRANVPSLWHAWRSRAPMPPAPR